MKIFALTAIRLYQCFVSPRKGFSCAYRVRTGSPSCSVFGFRAVRRYGVGRGVGVLRGRLERCGTVHREHLSPWENGHIESFHDKLRGECLNRELFGSLLEAQIILEQWRGEYNDERPHSSLRYQTPSEYARRAAALVAKEENFHPKTNRRTPV